MAEQLAFPKYTCHVRSISLPSRSHPLIVNVEDHLSRLRAYRSAESASSICHTLDGIKNLYECVNDMLKLPMTQQSLSPESHEKWAEEVLDGSLRLLDVCGTAKDVLFQMKESVQDLESSLRRRGRGGAGSDLSNEVGAYMVSRKRVNKMASKCIKNLKSFEKTRPSMLLDKDSNLVAIVSMLREVEAMSISTLKSLLNFVSGTQTRSKKNGWSLVSKMMQQAHVSCGTEEEAYICDVQKVDSLLSILNIKKLSNDIELVQNVMKQPETSESAIQEHEDGLESVYRCLIKTRVSLLNMLNQ